MATVHKLVKYELQSGNLPQYRHYVECSCGFQSRMAQEEAVKHQFDSHLLYHGQEPYFSKPLTPVIDDNKEEKQQGQTSNATGSGGLSRAGVWKPTGA